MPEDARELARFSFLCVAADVAPDLVSSLAALDELGDVATSWHLSSEWVLAYARTTLAGWARHPAQRGRGWLDRADGGAGWAAGGTMRVRPGNAVSTGDIWPVA